MCCVTVVKSYADDDEASTSSIEYEEPTTSHDADHLVTSSVAQAGTRGAVSNEDFDEEIYEDIEPTDEPQQQQQPASTAASSITGKAGTD